MRRCLFSEEINRMPVSKYDVLIVGSGVAGLYAALNLDSRISCAVITKDDIDTSSSWLAQGGVAAAVMAGDRPAFHCEDTLTAGAGLCDRGAVQILTEEAPRDIKALIAMGVPFDRDTEGKLTVGREGGHHRNRVLHACGDATGREIVKTLATTAVAKENIHFFPHAFLIDILTGPEGVSGAVVDRDGYRAIGCKSILLCTGGIGQMYNRSTNFSSATGDGLAAALRAGAHLRNLEFIQFHPTGLYQREAAERTFLISEAVRGEGAKLYNKYGQRFMVGRHPMAELAPRDIVAREITWEMQKTGENSVFLKISGKTPFDTSSRFPTIYEECGKRGMDLSRQAIPVCPVQHYLMGGIETDIEGRTSVPGLYACGETACTGVHGANRLASNSMLECLVFGRRAARSMSEYCLTASGADHRIPKAAYKKPVNGRPAENASWYRRRIREIMSSDCWIIRNRKGLSEGLTELQELVQALEGCDLPDREWIEICNMAEVAAEVLRASLGRTESVGAYYREDLE